MIAVLEELGGFFIFLRKIIHTTLHTKGNYRAIMNQVVEVSYRSLPTIAFAGVFVGAILVLQFDTMLKQYDARIFLGGLNTSALIREVGPLIISFLLAGKVGAYTAAELGTMRVTEQVDAIQCLGTDPIQYLILPRFYAIVISSVILLVIGLLISVMGSMGVAYFAAGVNPYQFGSSIGRFTGPGVIFSGVFRSLLYGTIVAGVCCFKGFTATGGAKGVGKAVTEAAIYTNLYIVIANYFSSTVIDEVGKGIAFLFRMFL